MVRLILMDLNWAKHSCKLALNHTAFPSCMTVHDSTFVHIRTHQHTQTVYMDNMWLSTDCTNRPKSLWLTCIGQRKRETDGCQDSLIVSLSHRVPKSTAAATSKANARHIVYLQKHHSWPCQHVKVLTDIRKKDLQVNT